MSNVCITGDKKIGLNQYLLQYLAIDNVGISQNVIAFLLLLLIGISFVMAQA